MLDLFLCVKYAPDGVCFCQVQQARDRLERLPVRKQAAASNGTSNMASKESHSASSKEQYLLPRYAT